MSDPRTLPLFDSSSRPSSWNERMLEGEFAVHDSFSVSAPDCTIFPSLADAERWSRARVAQDPALRCRIYDHDGLARPPVLEVRGSAYSAEAEMSPRFRRWCGSILFLGGLLLTAVDAMYDFRLSWPAMIGTRILLPGLLLLFIEAMVMLHTRSQGKGNLSTRRPA